MLSKNKHFLDSPNDKHKITKPNLYFTIFHGFFIYIEKCPLS